MLRLILKNSKFLFILVTLIFFLLFGFSRSDELINLLDGLIEGDNINIYNYGNLEIKEVFPEDNEYLEEYIIISSNVDFFGNIEIQGLGWSSNSLFVDIDLLSGESIIITSDYGFLNLNQNIIIVESINLKNSGESLKLKFNETILDDVDYIDSDGQALIFSYESGGIRYFENKVDPSVSISIPMPQNCEIIIENDILLFSGIDNNFCDSISWNINDNFFTGCQTNLFLDLGRNNIFANFLSGENSICSDYIKIYFETTNVSTGGNNSLNGEVLISEIHAEDYNLPEYIELKSNGNYSGNIEIMGLGGGDAGKEFEININEGNHIIVTDSLSGFLYTSNIILLPSISLTNDGENLTVYGQNGQLMDNVYYMGSEKGKSNYNGSNTSGDIRLFDYKKEKTPGFALEILGYFETTNVSTGGNNSLNGEVLISEIHAEDDNLPEYIELKSNGNYSGNIEIMGLGGGDAGKEFEININEGNHIIVTDSLSGFLYTSNIILLPSISLTNDGENLTVYGQNGQLMDKVYFTGGVGENVNYFGGNYSGDFRIFDESGLITPNFDHNLLNYHIVTGENQINKCHIQVQNSKYFYSSNSLNLIANFNDNEIQNSSSKYQCNWDMGNGIFLYECNPSYYSDYGEGLFFVILKIYENDELICETASYINNPKSSSGGGSSSSKSSYYENLYHKRKDNYNDLKSQIKAEGFNVSSKGKIYSKNDRQDFNSGDILLDDIIKIYSILPNPEGKDKDNEIITFELLSGEYLNLSGFSLEYSNKNKGITGFVYSGELFDIKGNFVFSNKGVCVKLRKGNFVYDRLCYENASEGEIFTGSNLNLNSDLSMLSNLKIEFIDSNVCITNDGEKLLCEKYNSGEKEFIIKNNILKIKSILPNPKGKDTNNEIVVLKLLTGESLNLSGFYIDNGKTNKPLSGNISNLLEIKSNWGLLNKGNCIRLISGDYIYDQFCYLNALDDEFIHNNLSFLGIDSIGIFSDIDINYLGSGQICLEYKNKNILCDNVSKIQDINKKYNKEKQKIIKLENQINLNQKKYLKQKEKMDEKISKIEEKLDEEKQKLKDYKSKSKYDYDLLYNQMRLYSNTLKLIKSSMKKDWYIIYSNGGFENIFNLSNTLKELIEKGYYEFDLGEKKYKLNNISQINKLLESGFVMDYFFGLYTKSLFNIIKDKVFIGK